MDRKASALWEGDIKNGRGQLSSDSGVLKNHPYSFATRFGDTPGTNPEELIAAAHAGCFTMALAGALGKKGFTADKLETSATVTIGKDGEGFKIGSSRLKLRAQVPDIDEKTFRAIAEDAKANCPVSKVLNAEISLEIDFHQSIHAGASH
ncbi:osmotically inducible protein OsmC [Bdellovibrio bacteriovorus]|uniref:Osmotically inducible protein OsmC n=1 Tax=Bdellovibrio bacteriovorus TaxID=959 RepID=A0A150WH93_BDEBC|nr:OsmC family protein [Bdellovibrio bacteriovorus]KYG62398.1 osmotically inducible protein OsmC [Bdellovibrio bacteriovorus]